MSLIDLFEENKIVDDGLLVRAEDAVIGGIASGGAA